MKSNLILFFILVSTSVVAQEFSSPIEYLKFIGAEQETISKSMWKYTSAVAHSKRARKIDNTRKQLVKTIQAASKKIAGLNNGYKGDVEFRDQTISYLAISEKRLNEEYDKIINMQEVAEQSYDAMEAYIMTRDLINKKIDEENEKFNAAYKAFALKHNIKLIDSSNELDNKMKISNEVFDYHSEIYLIFFKVNFTDGSLSKAIDEKNITAIQQAANSMIQYADEGLNKLKTIKPYKGDTSLINATKSALEFYKKQAQTFVPKIIDFYMFNDKFEKAKTDLESKKDKDKTQPEIDNYNAMVKQFNKEVDSYNKINATDFQEKSKFINNWNTTADNFISSHVPQN